MAGWRSIVLAAISLVLLVASLWLLVRSYWVGDHISWSKTIFSTPTPQDREYARQQGYSASSVDSGRLRSLNLSRGVLIYEHWNHRDVISLWDEPGARRLAREFDGWKWVQGPAEPVPKAANRWWSRLGFGYRVQRDGTPTGNPFYSFSVPLWLVSVVFAVGPAVHLLRWWRRRRRRGAGLCPRCGYDLRSTPDRCPECGAVAGGVVRKI